MLPMQPVSLYQLSMARYYSMLGLSKKAIKPMNSETVEIIFTVRRKKTLYLK